MKKLLGFISRPRCFLPVHLRHRILPCQRRHRYRRPLQRPPLRQRLCSHQVRSPSEEPTPVPTMVSYEPVSVDSWLANANCRMPDCSISALADGKPRLDKMVAWPEEGDPLLHMPDAGRSAEAFDTTVDELKALNPDWEENFARDGYFLSVKGTGRTILPQNDVVWVKVDAPWAGGYKTVYEVPASLDRQAAAAMVWRDYFQQNFCGGFHAGSLPYESAGRRGPPGSVSVRWTGSHEVF